MSDCYAPDEAYEAGIDSLTNEICNLQDQKHELEQRHQQLERIAREAVHCLESIPKFDGYHIDKDGYAKDCAAMLKEQLEECGVSIDD